MYTQKKCARCEGYGKLRPVLNSWQDRYMPYGAAQPIDCPDCKGKGFVRTRAKDKDFKCVDCGKEVNDIQGHYERVHPDKGEKK